MSRRLGITLIAVLALFLLWGSVSWYFGQASQRAFNSYVAQLSEHSHERFFEIEASEYQETYLGAEARLTVKFAVPSLDELFGEMTLKAKRLNGPLFIDGSRLSFGSARWTFTIDPHADEVLSNTVQTLFNGEVPRAVVLFDYFEQAHFEFFARYVRGSYFSADQFVATGEFDLNTGAYDLEVGSTQSQLTMPSMFISSTEPRIAIQRPAQVPGLDARSNAAIIDLSSRNAELTFKRNGKKIPLDLSSRGSVWLINDTLSGDWQALLETSPAVDSQKLHVNLQFREWLAEGLFAYWRQQMKIASLYEQADWVLEEGAETPEEQDFILSLYSDAGRIERSQAQSILKPMLSYQHSRLALNAQLKNKSDVLGQLIVSGVTDGSEQFPTLNLKGEVSVQQHVLSDSAISLLDTWNQRLWLRRYEAAYETDLDLRNQQFLLNNIRVSWEGLSSELKQLLNDQ